MSLFTPDSAAGRAVQELLREQREGLSIPQLRRLLQGRGFRLSEANLHDLLRRPDFDGPDPQGRYALRRLREEGPVGLSKPTVAQPRRRAELPPTLAHPPRLSGQASEGCATPEGPRGSYVVFDVETTGTDHLTGRILQLAALKIVDGAPDGVRPLFNRYVDPGDRRIPYTLQLKLHLERDSNGRLALSDAAPLREVVADFFVWAGDLPLVAHNARFDYRFLSLACEHELAQSLSWERLLDTMEIACLACPTLPSLTLEALAGHLANSESRETPQAFWQEVEQLAGVCRVPFDRGRFHDARVDVLVLAVVFERLRRELRRCLMPLAGWTHHLLPDLAEWLALPPVTAREWHTREVPERQTPEAPPPAVDHSVPTVLSYFRRLLEARGVKERPPQTEMVSHVATAFEEARFLMVEAPTGTGKTFAYLVPSILRARSLGRPVFVSTNTRNLQDQLVGDLEDLQRHLGVVFRYQPIKGMENYVCLERAGLFVEEFAASDSAHQTADERFGLLFLLTWLSATHQGLLDEPSYWFQVTFPSFAAVLQAVRAEWDRCDAAGCARRSDCAFRRSYERAREADVVVVNHALLLSRKWESTGLEFDYLVVDEAHNLEDAATNAQTRVTSLDTLGYVLGRLHDARSGRGLLVRLRRDLAADAEGQRLLSVAFQETARASHLVAEFGGHLLNYVRARKVKVHEKYGVKLMLHGDPRRITPRLWAPVQAARDALLVSLSELHSTLVGLRQHVVLHPLRAEFQAPTLREMEYLARRLDAGHPESEPALLTDILRVGYDSRVVVNWLEVEANGSYGDDERTVSWALKSAPVRVDRILEAQVYRPRVQAEEVTAPARRSSVVFTSATLRTTREDNFGFFIDRLGLRDYLGDGQAVALPAVLQYRRALFGIPRYMRYDARQQDMTMFAEEMAHELNRFFEFTDGKGLVLYTARDRMESGYAIMEPRLSELSIPLDYQAQDRSRRALAEEFKARVESVLLGLRSFWEGFDAPGETLTYVVLEKLPFPMIGEPIIQARAAQTRDAGGHEFFDYLLPLSFISFKQGFGRLLRKETDLGAVLLMDKRATRKSYYADLCAALPGPTLMHPEAERSRRAFYLQIAEHVNTLAGELNDAQARQAYCIDLDAKADLLEKLPEDILLDLERRLAALAIPDIVTESDIDEYMERVVQALREIFADIQQFREKQEDVIRQILLGRDVLAVLPTGSGKSLTFQLPALLRQGTTLVFSPLKALMKDQVDRLHSQRITLTDYIYSGQSADDQEAVFRKIRQGTTRLVYIAPERIRDPRLKEALRSACNITQVVVDEAHCVHTWGQSFRPDFLHIPTILSDITPHSESGRRPAVAAFTATATSDMQRSIIEKLHLNVSEVISRNPNRPELRFVVYNAHSGGDRIRSRRDKFTVLTRILRAADRDNEAAIVYCTTVREAEALTRRLDRAGFIVRCYHGRMEEIERVAAQELFIEGDVNIMVATKAFGMGIDKADVRYVIHYQMPGSLEDYYQEAGRCGRDGKTSYAVLLYHASDLKVHEYFIEKAVPPDHMVEAVLDYVRRQMPPDCDSTCAMINPLQMNDVLGDEAERMGLYLHLIENAGFVRRLDDITVQASTRLLVSVDQAVAFISGRRGASVATAFATMADGIGLGERTAIPLSVVETSRLAGLTPANLDKLLYWLAGEEIIIYRPFERGFVLQPQAKLWDGTCFDGSAYDAGRIRCEMQKRLAQMRRYAENLAKGDCYRRAALAYFGAGAPATPKDECCSLCDPNMRLPWSDITPVDFAGLEDISDARYVLLQTLYWNQSLADQPYRAPYGMQALSYLLTGNRHMLGKDQVDPARRARRIAQAESSPYFGALEYIRGREKAILTHLDELVSLGLAGFEVRRFADGGSYQYPIVLSAGEARLRDGRLFDRGAS